ncbi:ExeA family protein [Geobacter sp. SVR]|uniref:ExeA family protein n=1 Tax=Geobacter sp. SVR TaxID=2495594 RepID=UPI00143F03F3|nr:AAA family ATPase [Geobacter sp. SVR]BCS53846.1 ATPase [Geobacter sp. SVR]GCF85645.1 ATPase [Geobacter sp. SVR]
MYKRYFGFTEKPFSKTPDPRFLFFSRGHEEALARLEFVVEEREIAVLTGDIGCGKTTISRALMDRLGDRYRFCYIVNPRLNALEFLRATARLLDVERPAASKNEVLEQINAVIYDHYLKGICPVIVVDEAQMIADAEVFDEIRLLTNFQLDAHNLLAVVIMGQPELRSMLSSPRFEPLRQRIALHYHLCPLSLEETMEYLDFRLEMAGGEAGLFTPDAVQKVYELTGGVPRKINSVATNALLVAYGNDAALIDSAIINEIKDEMMM